MTLFKKKINPSDILNEHIAWAENHIGEEQRRLDYVKYKLPELNKLLEIYKYDITFTDIRGNVLELRFKSIPIGFYVKCDEIGFKAEPKCTTSYYHSYGLPEPDPTVMVSF